MNVCLSRQLAAACWGEKASFSIQGQTVTVHLTGNEDLLRIQQVARKLDGLGLKNLQLTGKEWELEPCWAFWQGYRSPKNCGGKNVAGSCTATIGWPVLSVAEQQELNHRLHIVDWVRDITNQPADDLSPEQLAQRAVDLLTQFGGDAVRYRISKGETLREQNYLGLYNVGRGSSRPPVLLSLDYTPAADEKGSVFACLVGKGITFDSGGYSLKPTSFMDSMKADMGGAALVTGAMALAIARGLQRRVKLFLCCADNMVSGNAIKLGDIIHYRNGKTVEIMNTDAEGRLVLADGLIDASAQQPEIMIDCATLTGAAKTALGNDYHALLSFDDILAQRLLHSAATEQEAFWRLPLEEFHRKQLPSGFAELNNTAGASSPAGASTAAAFLSHFVSQYQRGWLHIDCAAAYRKVATDQWAVGATGIGVRTLANLLCAG